MASRHRQPASSLRVYIAASAGFAVLAVLLLGVTSVPSSKPSSSSSSSSLRQEQPPITKAVAEPSKSPAPVLCEKGLPAFQPDCARALAESRSSWNAVNPWLQDRPAAADIQPDEAWMASLETHGCCPTGTGGIALDHTLRMMFGAAKKQGVYIESGANDGETQSNTLLFAERRGWGGLLVEPLPSTFAKLRARRCRDSSSNRDICTQVALVAKGQEGGTIRLSDKGLMAQTSANGIEVPTATLSGQIDRYLGSHPAIDFWSLDIEGAELGAIAGVDWNRHRPAFILVETHQLEAVQRALGAVGYELLTNIVATGSPDSVSGWTHVIGHDHLFRDKYAPDDVPKVPLGQNPVRQPGVKA